MFCCPWQSAKQCSRVGSGIVVSYRSYKTFRVVLIIFAHNFTTEVVNLIAHKCVRCNTDSFRVFFVTSLDRTASGITDDGPYVVH